MWSSRDTMIILLVLWGIILDGIVLTLLPLMGVCDPWNTLITSVSCTETSTPEFTGMMYLFLSCGVARALAGLHPVCEGGHLTEFHLSIGQCMQCMQMQMMFFPTSLPP